MADSTDTTDASSTPSSWLDQILNTGLAAYQASQAKQPAAKTPAAAPAKFNWVPLAAIGGAVLGLVLILVLVSRRGR